MKNSLFIMIFGIAIMLFNISVKAAQKYYIPINKQCILSVSEIYDIPPWLLIAILDVEGGSIGTISENKNGSYDIGPMQINSLWLDKLKKSNIDLNMLRFNGCLNVQVGGWILKKNLNRYKDDFWKGIGAYHSRTDHLNKKYRKLVYKHIRKLKDLKNIDEIIKKANKLDLD